jgi:hypothetical protein
MGKEDWAIVVGLTHYPGLSALVGPGRDAQAFYEWVTKPETQGGGGVPKSQAKLILSSDFPAVADPKAAEPTVQEVYIELENLQDIALANSEAGKGLRTGRRLYLFFAGHGCAPVFDESALLMANATRLRPGHHLPGRRVANWFLVAGYFEEVILLMDCCRERFTNLGLAMPPFIDRPNLEAFAGSKRFFGFGTKWASKSRERDFGGVTRGVFTVALLEALGGAAAEPTGKITAESLGSWLYNSMKTFLAPEDIADPEIPKEPDLDWDNSPQGRNFVIAQTVPKPSELRVTFPAAWGGSTARVLGGDFSEKATTTIQTGAPWVVLLEQGIYLILVDKQTENRKVEIVGSEPVYVAF